MNCTESSMFNRLLAALLSFVMVVALFPVGLLVSVEAAPGDAEENVGFTVTVTDNEGAPISGASVEISGQRMGTAWNATAVTDEEGVAVFADIAKNLSERYEQDVTVKVTADRYVGRSETVSLSKSNLAEKSMTVVLEIKLPYNFTVATEDENAEVTLNGESVSSVTVFGILFSYIKTMIRA